MAGDYDVREDVGGKKHKDLAQLVKPLYLMYSGVDEGIRTLDFQDHNLAL